MRFLRYASVVWLGVALGGCSSGDEGDLAPSTVVRLDAHRTLGEAVTVSNLTVWPVYTDAPLDVGEFLTLQEALLKGVAEVREVGVAAGGGGGGGAAGPQPREQTADVSTGAAEAPGGDSAEAAAQELADDLRQALSGSGGAVNTLVIENRGDLPILVCAGTVVKGGNQDRQIGQDFVLKAKSTTPVDAFCVEQGRWEGQRLGKATDGKFEVARTSAFSVVRAKGQYERDQSGVWAEVGKVKGALVPFALVGVEPREANQGAATIAFREAVRASSSFAVALDANAEASGAALAELEDAVRDHFKVADDAVGFAYAINGQPVNVRAFAHPRVFRQQFDAFVRTMAAEAFLAGREGGEAPAAQASDVVALVKEIEQAREKRTATKGLNANGVRSSQRAYAASCYIPGKDGQEIALTQDWTARR